MKTLKEFIKHSLKEFQYGNIPTDWGFIDPHGKVLSGPDTYNFDPESSSHDELAQKLGFKSYPEALAQGYIRYRKDGPTGTFELRGSAEGRIEQFLLKNPGITQLGLDSDSVNGWFGSAEDALKKLRSVI